MNRKSRNVTTARLRTTPPKDTVECRAYWRAKKAPAEAGAVFKREKRTDLSDHGSDGLPHTNAGGDYGVA